MNQFNLTLHYLIELRKRKCKPLKIASHFENNTLNIWAIVNENDKATENKLFITEAIINAKYNTHDLRVNTFITEDCDTLKIPSHYKQLIKP